MTDYHVDKIRRMVEHQKQFLAERDRLIREASEAGVPHGRLAKAARLTAGRISQIVNRLNVLTVAFVITLVAFWALFALVAVPRADAQNAQAATYIPRLTKDDARYYAKVTLRRRFKTTWRSGYNRKVKCGVKLSYRKRRCKVSWLYGDLGYSGKVVIQYRDIGGIVYWYYGLYILRTNYYCLSQTAELAGDNTNNCYRRYRVRL